MINKNSITEAHEFEHRATRLPTEVSRKEILVENSQEKFNENLTFTSSIENTRRPLTVVDLVERYNIGRTNEKLVTREMIEERLRHARSRQEEYEILYNEVINTPLLEIKDMLPNGNTLYIKCESETSLGNSHYMRVYYALIKHYEEIGAIKPGDTIYDYSSGTSGISMAAIGSLLGYVCEVGIPAGGEKAREDAILEWIPKEHLHFSDASKYVAGALDFNKQFLRERRDVFFLNHSMTVGANKELLINSVSTDGCAEAIEEVQRDLEGKTIDIFVTISGNGTTQFGYGKKCKDLYPDVQIVGAEAFQSALVFEKLRPGMYEKKYGITLDDRSKFSRHRLPGTTYPGNITYPALEASLAFLSEEKLMWDQQALEEYREISGRDMPEDAIFFDKDIPDEIKIFGRTTSVGFKVAEGMAKKTYGKNYLIFAYDHADRYDK